MKSLSIVLLTILISTAYSFTQIEVPKDKHPFYKIVEWPNHGSLLMAKDISGSVN